MEVKSQKLPKNLMEIIVELTSDEMAIFCRQVLEDIANETEIAGFRKGHAPLNLVEQQISSAKILEEAARIAIDQKYAEIIEKEKLNPAGPPEVEIIKLAPDNPFIFKLKLPLIPNVKPNNWKKIKVKREKIKISVQEIDNALKEVQKLRRKETAVERPSQMGDRLEVELNLFLDKVPLEGGQIKNFSLILGEDYYIPGLSNNLIGSSRGEEKEFPLPYPADFYDKKLAGKTIDFKAKINNIYQIELPAVDDVLAQGLGAKNLQDLKEQLRKRFEDESAAKEEERLELEVLKEAVKQAEFEEIPDVLTEHELDKMLAELKYYIEDQGGAAGAAEMKEDFFQKYLESIKKTEEDLRKEFIPKAEERVKTALLIRRIADEEKISASEEEIKAELDKLTNLYQGNKEILDRLNSIDGQIYLKNSLVNRKAIELLKRIAAE